MLHEECHFLDSPIPVIRWKTTGEQLFDARGGSFGLHAFDSLAVFLLQCRISTAIPFV